MPAISGVAHYALPPILCIFPTCMLVRHRAGFRPDTLTIIDERVSVYARQKAVGAITLTFQQIITSRVPINKSNGIRPIGCSGFQKGQDGGYKAASILPRTAPGPRKPHTLRPRVTQRWVVVTRFVAVSLP